MTKSDVELVDTLLQVLRTRGVTEFQGHGLTLRMGTEPVVRRVLVPVRADAPHGPDATPLPTAQEAQKLPLTPEQREQVLSDMEEDGALFDAVKRSV